MPGVDRTIERALLAVLVAVTAVAARPAAAETLILVEVPAPVERAVRTGLAPWGLEIVVVDPAPAIYAPGELAAERGATFVAWRRGDELVLYDAALAAEERRPLSADPDDAEAAAVALSIKTWMGLGPPPGDGVICGLHDCPRPPPPRRWLIEVATGVRIDPAGQGGAVFRYAVAAGHRRGRFELGLRLDLGMDRDGQGFGQDGVWSVTAFGAWGRAGLQVSRTVEVLPGAGIGIIHTGFSAPRTGPGEHDDADSSTTFALDGELGVRWRRGRLTAGGRLGLTMVPRGQVLSSRSLEQMIDAHVEPWLLAMMSVLL